MTTAQRAWSRDNNQTMGNAIFKNIVEVTQTDSGFTDDDSTWSPFDSYIHLNNRELENLGRLVKIAVRRDVDDLDFYNCIMASFDKDMIILSLHVVEDGTRSMTVRNIRNSINEKLLALRKGLRLSDDATVFLAEFSKSVIDTHAALVAEVDAKYDWDAMSQEDLVKNFQATKP